MIRLFINDKSINLKEGEKISYTKQVNSFTDLSSRQTNVMRTLRVPKTPNNIATFQGLGITGSQSNIPYQKNTIKLFEEFIPIILKGWAIFQDTGKDYEIHGYDGNIDFFKAMDNVEFNDIDLSELEHQKDTAEVKNNWENGNAAYKYLLADYNGITHYDDNGTLRINTDYLIPSVSVAWLWERIFNTFGWTYTGSTFQTEKFNNLFLTFPKGEVSAEVQNDPVFELFSNIPPAEDNEGWQDHPLHNIPSFGITQVLFGSYSPDNANVVTGTFRPSWRAVEPSFHEITLTGEILGRLGEPYEEYPDSEYITKIGIGKNLHDISSQSLYDSLVVEGFTTNAEITNALNDGKIVILETSSRADANPVQIDKTVNIFLEEGDSISLFYSREWPFEDTLFEYSQLGDYSSLDYNMAITQIDQSQIDQFEFLKGLSVKDFFKEVIWKFGLTPFPDKIYNTIDFLTLDERINGAIEDWSDRFIEQTNEEYVYDSYAKKNWFRFQYNGEGEDFNDAAVNVANANLEDSKPVIVSKSYSPAEIPSILDVAGNEHVVPKLELWQKELKDDNGQATIEYKSRDARFSFLREVVLEEQASIGSKILAETATVSKVRLAENYDYSWGKIVNEDYLPINDILRKSKIIKADFKMSALQFYQFDLKPRIHVKQLGGDFIVDKLTKKDLQSTVAEAVLIKINK